MTPSHTPPDQAGRPVRLKLSRAKGFDLQAHSLATNGLPAVVVARPTKWRNPFDFRRSEFCWTALSYGCRGDRAGRQEASVRAFAEWIDTGPNRQTVSMEFTPKLAGPDSEMAIGPTVKAGRAPLLADLIAALRGRNLACWCALDEPCHADVLLRLASAPVCDTPTPPDPLAETTEGARHG